MPTIDDIAPLPTFFDGIPLSAGDLNKIGAVQEYIYHANQRWNIPFKRWEAGGSDVKYLRNTHRYLYYQVSATLDLTINAVNYGTVMNAGYIDLDPAGANPYGLVPNVMYGLELSGSGYAEMFHEWPRGFRDLDPDSAAAAPTFTIGQVVSAAQLNKICSRTQYFLDNYTFNPITSFPSDDTGDIDKYYTFRHTHRYLYVCILGTPDGNHDFTYDWRVLYGDNYNTAIELFENDWADQAGAQRVNITLDMEQGTDHVLHELADDPTGPDPDYTIASPWPIVMPAKGEYYTICIHQDNQWDGHDRRYAICEVPFNTNYLVGGNYGLKDDE